MSHSTLILRLSAARQAGGGQACLEPVTMRQVDGEQLQAIRAGVDGVISDQPFFASSFAMMRIEKGELAALIEAAIGHHLVDVGLRHAAFWIVDPP